MTSVFCVFPKKRNERTKKVCLGYQSETLKQHDLGKRSSTFFYDTSHVSEKFNAYEYYVRLLQRERQRQRNDDDDTNTNFLLFAFFEKDVVVKKELFVVFVF